MCYGMSDFIKAIPHPSDWDKLPPEYLEEGWVEIPPLLGRFSCMYSPANNFVHNKEENTTKCICVHIQS